MVSPILQVRKQQGCRTNWKTWSKPRIFHSSWDMPPHLMHLPLDSSLNLHPPLCGCRTYKLVYLTLERLEAFFSIGMETHQLHSRLPWETQNLKRTHKAMCLKCHGLASFFFSLPNSLILNLSYPHRLIALPHQGLTYLRLDKLPAIPWLPEQQPCPHKNGIWDCWVPSRPSPKHSLSLRFYASLLLLTISAPLRSPRPL